MCTVRLYIYLRDRVRHPLAMARRDYRPVGSSGVQGTALLPDDDGGRLLWILASGLPREAGRQPHVAAISWSSAVAAMASGLSTCGDSIATSWDMDIASTLRRGRKEWRATMGPSAECVH